MNRRSGARGKPRREITVFFVWKRNKKSRREITTGKKRREKSKKEIL